MTDQPQFDLNALMQAAQTMGEQLAKAQEEAASRRYVGTAAGGAVRVTVTGGMEFERVQIDPSVVDPEEADLLEDLVLAAIRDGVNQAAEGQSGGLTGLDLDALGGLGGLGGLLGPGE